ncbi:MAG TPA: hypothetical protein VIB49_11160 [Thermoplasmata archaeon]
MSGYLRDSQLRRQLEERVKEATRTRQAAEQGLKAAQEVLDAARKVDANVVEAEKVLADASAAMGVKDYKLAAEKAAEATERGKRIYRDRVSAIIESSASLATLVKGVGADPAEAEAAVAKSREALAAEDLPNAIELAKKSWRKSEKMLSEHLSSSFSKLQSLILSAKNLGRDTASGEDLLSRARAAMENNDYPSALNFTKEGLEAITEDLASAMGKDLRDAEDIVRTAQDLGADVTKASTLLERARTDIAGLEFEKANNALRQCKVESERSLQKSLEGKIADFTKFVSEAQAIGADTTAAQGHFSQAEGAIKQGDFKQAAQLAKRGFQALQDAQFRRVVQTIAASREKFVAAVNLGLDIKEAIDHLNNARAALQRGAFREALDSAKGAGDVVDAAVARVRKIQDRLKELHRAFAEAEARGASTVSARRGAERARVAYQKHDLDGVEREIEGAREELQKAEREQVMRVIEAAEFTLTMAEQNGIDVSDASKILQDAIVATKANEHRRALDLSSQAQGRAEDILRDHVVERVTVLKNALVHLGGEGEPLRGLIARAESATTNRDFEGALRGLEEGRTFVEERTRHEAEGLVESLGLAVQLGLDLGANVASDESLYKVLNGAMGRGNVADVLAARDRVQGALAAAAENLSSLTKVRIATAQSLKIDVEEMSDYFKRAGMAFAVQNYMEGLRLLREASDRASKATAMHRQAYTALSTAAAIVADAKKRNVDVSKVVDILVDGKKALERLDYAQAIELSAKVRSETEKLAILYTSAQKILANRERMELASKLGIDAPHLRDLASEAKEAMKAKDYENAAKLASKSEEEFTSLIKEKITTILDTVESIASSVEGVSLAEVGDGIARARDVLGTGELAQAADLALGLRDQLEKLKKQGEETAGALRHVRELTADAEALNLEVPATLSLMEKAERAYKSGHFEESMDYVSKAEAELVQERDHGIGSLMKRFEESIEKAKREGTDVRSAEKLFERSREFFRAKKYRQALATALQSEAEAERVSLQQSMASQAVETVERKLKALGRPAPTVEQIADEARTALVKGDYVKSLDSAIKATDALVDYRALYDEAQEVRIRAQALRQTAREVHAEAEKLDRFIREGDAALEAGDVEAARAAFTGCLEWGVGLLRSHLKEELTKAEEKAALCTKLEIDPTSILNRLSEARSQIDAESFSAAALQIEAARASAEQALGSRLGRTLQEAAANVAHARKLGADARGVEELLQEANERIGRGEYEAALDIANRAIENLESVKVVEKRFVDLTYKTETTIRNGKKFGIDMRAAEQQLAASIELRKKDFASASKAAEDAYRLAWEAVEAFAPNVRGSLVVAPAQLNEWTDATVELENVGKGLAKDVRVQVLGDAETEGLQDIPAVRAHGKESLKFRLKITAPGSVPLAIQVVSHRVFDGKEYTQEMIAQVEVAETAGEKPKKLVAGLDSRCPICKGGIKKGFKVVRCACGRDVHDLCAARVGRCPVCFRALGGAV